MQALGIIVKDMVNQRLPTRKKKENSSNLKVQIIQHHRWLANTIKYVHSISRFLTRKLNQYYFRPFAKCCPPKPWQIIIWAPKYPHDYMHQQSFEWQYIDPFYSVRFLWDMRLADVDVSRRALVFSLLCAKSLRPQPWTLVQLTQGLIQAILGYQFHARLKFVQPVVPVFKHLDKNRSGILAPEVFVRVVVYPALSHVLAAQAQSIIATTGKIRDNTITVSSPSYT